MRIPRSGFTLFELVLVMVLLVIVGALSYPSLSSMYGGFKVTAAADEVRSAWAQARAHAINEGTPYRFAVVPGKGNYRIAPDVESYWAGQGGQQAPEDPTVRPLVMQDALPKGVSFASKEDTGTPPSDTVLEGVDPSHWVTRVVFLPDGTARDDAEMLLRVRGARPLIVRIRGLTGDVTTRPPENDSHRR
jgi:prepilin-type N-terminal cleavage/methylation domain-containing protein